MKYFLSFIFSTLVSYYLFIHTNIGDSAVSGLASSVRGKGAGSVEFGNYTDFILFASFSPFIILIFIFYRISSYFIVYDENASHFQNAVGRFFASIFASFAFCLLAMPVIILLSLAFAPKPILDLVRSFAKFLSG